MLRRVGSSSKRQVYELVDLPPNHKVIGNRWVLNQKMDRQKWARLMAKGYSQVKGIDYSEIFSPVIHYEFIHLMFTLVALKNWYITSLLPMPYFAVEKKHKFG